MAKIIDITPYVRQSAPQVSPVYAVVTVPLVKKAPQSRKRSFTRTLSWILDIAVSAGLGAMMLIFLLLLIISL